MRERISAAYVAAMDACHQGASVRIHVGPAVGDHLKALCEVLDQHITDAKLFGFPLVVEEDWPGDQIVVRSDVVIA